MVDMKIRTLNSIKKYLIFSIILTIAIVSGITYAFLQKESKGSDTYSVTTLTCLSISLTSQTNTINLTNSSPISDEAGMNQTPFKFTVKNNCSKPVNINLTLEVLSSSTLDSEYVQSSINYNNEKIMNNRILTDYGVGIPATPGNKNYVLSGEMLQANESRSYDYRSWIDYNITKEQGINKVFNSKIFVTGEYSTGLLKDAVLLQDGGKVTIEAKLKPNYSESSPNYVYSYKEKEPVITAYTPEYFYMGSSYKINTPEEMMFGRYAIPNGNYYDIYSYTFTSADEGKYFCEWDYECDQLYRINTVRDGMVTSATMYLFNYSKDSINLSGNGIFAEEDEYGATYYYRGSKEHLKNNLIFANMQWKIIRINGDGSIRIIYNGTCPNDNCSINDTTGVTAFNSAYNTSYTDNKYVGYMYGNTSDNYANAHANINNSTIKTNLDNWYNTNIIANGFGNKVVDNIFCNDREIDSGNGFGGTGTTYYKFNLRVKSYSDPTPTLKCAQVNDRFTVTTSSIGNKKLTYPVGLITADELYISGKISYNYDNFLYTGTEMWTMTPYFFTTTMGTRAVVAIDERNFDTVNTTKGVRPVINLSSTVKVTGNGSESSPFKVIY